MMFQVKLLSAMLASHLSDSSSPGYSTSDLAPG